MNDKQNAILFNKRANYYKNLYDTETSLFRGKDSKGNPSGVDILTKEKAYEASLDIIMKWNDLPE